MGELAQADGVAIYELRADDGKSWQIFPHAALRIARFAKEYDSDANTVLMMAHVKSAFVFSPASTQQILVAIDGDKIVGHVFTAIEEWFDTKFATVVQYELDEAVPFELLSVGLKRIEEWSKERGAAFMQCLARNEKVARAFSMFHGFTRNRVIMRKTLSTAVAVVEESA